MTDVRRGFALLDHGQIDEADRIARRAVGADPQDPYGWRLLLAVLWRQDDYGAVVDAGTRALTELPDDAEILTDVGAAHNELDQHEQAARLLRQAVVLAPDDAAAHVQLARALAELGDHDAARREGATALELAPDSAYIHHNWALAQISMNDKHAAEASVREALRLDPEYVNAHITLGYLADLRFDRQLAIEHTVAAARLDPTNRAAIGNLSNMVRSALGTPWLTLFVVFVLAWAGAGPLPTLLVAAPLLLLRWMLRFNRYHEMPVVARNVARHHARRQRRVGLGVWRVVALVGWLVLLAAASEIIGPGFLRALCGAALVVQAGHFTAGAPGVVTSWISESARKAERRADR